MEGNDVDEIGRWGGERLGAGCDGLGVVNMRINRLGRRQGDNREEGMRDKSDIYRSINQLIDYRLALTTSSHKLP